MAQSDKETFLRIEFAEQDAKLSTAPLKLKEWLAKNAPPSWVKKVEVYHFAPSTYFYDQQAILLSQDYLGIALSDRGKMIRADFINYPGLSAFITWP
jgi:hypothetical protein